MAKKKPGVMLYHEWLPYRKKLSFEQMGRLFIAILDYSENGIEPDFSDDDRLDMAWLGLSLKIDRDSEKYKENCDKRAYAAYCREADRAGRPKMTFDEWKEKTEYFDIT